MLSASIGIGKLNMALTGQSGLINSPLNVVSPPFAGTGNARRRVVSTERNGEEE
jgi:hypothetical protein